MYKFSHSFSSAPRSNLRVLLTASLLASALTSPALAQEKQPRATTTKAVTTGAETAPKKQPRGAAEAEEAEEASDEAKAADDATAEEADVAAEPTDEEKAAAKEAFEAGTKAFGEEDYATAVTQFEKAHATVPTPHTQYWVARAMDEADPENEKAEEVVAAYGEFLSNPGAQHAGAEKVSEAQARVVDLKKLLPAKITLTTVPEGATVTIDGTVQDGTTPVELELPAGAHQFEIALEGYEATMVEMDVAGGSSVEQEVTLAKEAPPPAPAPAEEPSPAEPAAKKSMVPAAVTLGLGGAGLISGTLFGIMALGAKSDFKDDPTTENADAAERNALIADMSFGIALTLGITGVVLLTAEDEEAAAEAASKRRVLVAPYADKKGGGLAGMFRF